MARNKTTALLFFFCVSFVFGQETLKTMTYNVLNYPTAPPANRPELLQLIMASYEPDLLMLTEVESDAGAQQILTEAIQPTWPYFESSTFVPIQSDPDTDNPLQQMVYYNTFKLTLENEEVYKTDVRDINRYTFLLNTTEQDQEPVRLEVFVAHLKSSDGTANKQTRLNMTQVFTEALENNYADDETHEPIAPNSYVLFAGDMNFYTSSEPAYQELLNEDASNIYTMVDVLNPTNELQSWNTNSSWQAMHTQATREFQFGGFGASSGMDDRFDFVFFSENLFDNPTLEYVENSYAAYGNNGNCFDKSVNDQSCDGEYDLDLRENLYYMSDHLPVVMELQTDQQFLDTPNYTKPEILTFPEGTMPGDYLRVVVLPEARTEVSLSLYNTLGQKLSEIENQDTGSYRIDFSGFPAGVYFLNANTATTNTSYKILKKN